MLKLALTDTLNQIHFFEQHIGGLKRNISTLKHKLPDMSAYAKKRVSEIKKDLEKGEGTIIDINRNDEDKDD